MIYLNVSLHLLHLLTFIQIHFDFFFHFHRRFENEVVSMTASMLNGDEEVVGSLTSGGTESILMAMKAYRDRARRMFPHIKRPEMVGLYVTEVILIYISHYEKKTHNSNKHITRFSLQLTWYKKTYQTRFRPFLGLFRVNAP